MKDGLENGLGSFENSQVMRYRCNLANGDVDIESTYRNFIGRPNSDSTDGLISRFNGLLMMAINMDLRKLNYKTEAIVRVLSEAKDDWYSKY